MQDRNGSRVNVGDKVLYSREECLVIYIPESIKGWCDVQDPSGHEWPAEEHEIELISPEVN